MNSNLNELPPFTAFQQADNFGSQTELPKSSLEIDLGGPSLLPQTTSQDINNFFSPAASPSPRPFFSLGDGDLVDDKITTSGFLSQTDNDQHQSSHPVAPGTPDNGEIEIPVIIETVNGTPDSEHFISDFQFSDHPASSFGKLKLESPETLLEENSLASTTASGNQGIRDSLIIDLNEQDRNIIPKIPGNSVSFSFTRFGSGDKATSFGFNFQDNKENFLTNFVTEQPRNSAVKITTPSPRVQITTRQATTTVRTTRRTTQGTTRRTTQRSTRRTTQKSTTARVTTNPFPTLSVSPVSSVRATTSSTFSNPFPSPQPTQLPVRTGQFQGTPSSSSQFFQTPGKPVVFTGKPVVFTRKPVVSFLNPRERPRGGQRRPPNVPGFELFKLSSLGNNNNNLINNNPVKVVNGAKPPRPRNPPPNSFGQLKLSDSRARPPTRTSPRPMLVFSTPTPTLAVSSTPRVPPVFLSSTLAPLNSGSVQPLVFTARPGVGGEIVIPLNITEVKPAGNRPHTGNRPGQVKFPNTQDSQLPRKPKNQLVGLRGKPLDNSLGNSPFVFLRQQLQEVKQNIFLPSGLTGVNNPFRGANLRPPQPTPTSPIVFSPFQTVGPVQSPRPTFLQTVSPVRQDPETFRRPVVPFVFSNPIGRICSTLQLILFST